MLKYIHVAFITAMISKLNLFHSRRSYVCLVHCSIPKYKYPKVKGLNYWKIIFQKIIIPLMLINTRFFYQLMSDARLLNKSSTLFKYGDSAVYVKVTMTIKQNLLEKKNCRTSWLTLNRFTVDEIALGSVKDSPHATKRSINCV